jgi:hypothetical protein
LFDGFWLGLVADGFWLGLAVNFYLGLEDGFT